ncbi:hypothetical protein NHX12_004573 [Muraenolepis orangiensis]|uniref:Acyl-CoA thioester hydrolase/bile acid-CoA amino acid N-acetyltransferase domain-containing protein n=1 Tax=Muraenolepis orangiensis TaxID=630683 RepID=A0A9Q0IDY9_9TELE|nr:hypothetical protein NHX12_004573 [Muraenolepis orangiensis]
MSSLVRLRLLPSAKCLYTQPVQVLVDGLRSSQVVTVKAGTTDDKGTLFHASAVYRAGADGGVDLGRDPSLGGSYRGFSVHEGEEEAGATLAEATNERRLLADGVSRQPIDEGNIRGVLFVPPGG